MISELRSITTFVRTVELGSLSKAAEAQQISPQAASKALRQLETYLGVRLFHRTTRSMSLTEEGQRFLEAAQPALLGLQQALSAARQTREAFAGPLRIVGPRSVAQMMSCKGNRRRAISPSCGERPIRKPTSTRSSTQLPMRSSSCTSGWTSG